MLMNLLPFVVLVKERTMAHRGERKAHGTTGVRGRPGTTEVRGRPGTTEMRGRRGKTAQQR